MLERFFRAGAIVTGALVGISAGACAASSPNGNDADEATSGADTTDTGSSGPTTGSGGSVSDPGGDPTTCDEAATSRSYIGCDFWPTVTINSIWSIFDYAVVVTNAGTEDASVTVTRGGAQVATATVAPGTLSKIYLPWVAELKGADGDTCTSLFPYTASIKSVGGAYHLVSTAPVTVYQFNALEYGPQGGPPGKDWSSCPGYLDCPGFGPVGCFSYSNDASLLIPSTAMTQNYRVIASAGEPASYWGGAGTFLAVTAVQDGTAVTVQASAKAKLLAGGGLSGAPEGGTTKFTLNAGDVAEILTDVGEDLGGSLVQADKPVQVLSGHPCSAHPDVEDNTCDHVEETVFPAETLGKHYVVTAPTGPYGAPVGQVVRLFGNIDGTTLTYPAGAPPNAPTSINAGQTIDLGTVTGDFEIQGDHEIGIATL